MRILRGSAVVVTFGFVALVACKKDEPAPPPTPSTPSASAATAPAPAAASVAHQSEPPKPSKEKKTIPKAVAEAYAAGLKKGRGETLAKRYDAAIAGFDAALKALPGDARALSERGYAKLLAGKTEDAAKDFHAALAATKEPKLLAQIHYNLGLCAEKLGQTEDAKVAFTRSNALVPSKAAAAKAGASACAAKVSFTSAPALAAKDHKGLFAALTTANKGTAKVGSDTEAKDVLGSRAGEAARGNVLSFPPEDDTSEWLLHAYVKTQDGYLAAPAPASTYYDMPCGGEVSSKVTESSGLALVRVTHAPGMRVPVCETDAGELTVCGPDDMQVQSACGTSDEETTIVVFDTQKKSVVAEVSFSAENKVPKVTLEGRKLTIDGAGCSATRDL